MVMDAVFAIVLMEGSHNASRLLDGDFSILRADFPADPDAEYSALAESVLGGMGLDLAGHPIHEGEHDPRGGWGGEGRFNEADALVSTGSNFGFRMQHAPPNRWDNVTGTHHSCAFDAHDYHPHESNIGSAPPKRARNINWSTGGVEHAPGNNSMQYIAAAGECGPTWCRCMWPT